MLRSTFTAFYRSFTRHPLYALLNLLGLSLGIAVFVTLGLFFRFETTFEQWLPHADNLHTVELTWTMDGSPGNPSLNTSGSLFDDMKADFGVKGTRLLNNNVTVHIGSQSTAETLVRVDPDFFQVFALHLQAGDVASALATPSSVMLSQEMAGKYFPNVPVAGLIGRTLRLTDDEGTVDYRISAVFDTPPSTTDTDFKFIRLLTPAYMAKAGNWTSYGSQRLTTVVLSDPAAVAPLEKLLPAFLDRHASKNFAPDIPHKIMRLNLFPFVKTHLQDARTRTSVFALGIVGVLAFFIAAINYVNLATARAGMRAKEVAVRKTLGATQGSLRTQFLCEAVLTTIIAALIGLSLVEVSLPLINSFGGLKLRLDYAGQALPLVAAGAFIVLCGLVAGLYPAFVLSAFKPAQVLAAARTPAGGRWAVRLREALVVVQFTVVIAFFIIIIGFTSQLQHMKTADLGFQRGGLMVTGSTYDDALSNSQRDAIWAAFRAIPGVVSVTVGSTAPGDDSETNGTNIVPPGYKGPTLIVGWVLTGPDYFTTYGGHLIAGRWLDPKHGDDIYVQHNPDGSRRKTVGSDLIVNVVINRAALKRVNCATADACVGQVMTFDGDTKVRIVGVVENMRFHTPKDTIFPTVFGLDATPYDHSVTGLRYAGVTEPVIRERMQAAWKQIAPDVPFKATSAVENIDEYYKPDRNRSNLFSVGAGVAALIGCIGLYGMAAFNTSRRAREVGLRKVLGASSGQVTRLLVGQFLRPVVLANILAWPLAFFALKQWLSQFDDAVGISPLYFIIATAVAILIALVTVGGLALASAGSEPGKALRHE